MNFDLSPEQKQLKDSARRFLEAECPPDRVREGGSAQLWQKVAAQGWIGAGIPEIYGGIGMGPVETCVIAEELGRALAPLPFATTVYLAAEAIMLFGSEEHKLRHLPGICEGTVTGCLAVSETPGTRRTPACIVSGTRLSGTKLPVLDGMGASLAIVTAIEDGRHGLYLVPLDGAGVARAPVATLDPTRGAARIDFDGAPAERLADDAGAALAMIGQRAAVYIAFEQLGGADRCLEMARDYALERHAFGAPIGRYQAIKHKLADLFVGNELARSNAYYAAWALEADAAELPVAAAAARVAASDAYWQASKENIQTHGGIGFTWELDCHLHYRRAHLLSLMIGPPREWKLRLFDALQAA